MSARRPVTNQRLIALGIVLTFAAGLVFWFRFAPYGMSQDEAEAAVQRLGRADAQYFYLGEEADGHKLAKVGVDAEDGRMIFEYGRCMDHDEGGCNRPLNVYSTPTQDSSSEEDQRSCVMVHELRDQGQVVDLGSSVVEITYWKTIPEGYMTDFERSKALVPRLRKVGEAQPSLCSQPKP